MLVPNPNPNSDYLCVGCGSLHWGEEELKRMCAWLKVYSMAWWFPTWKHHKILKGVVKWHVFIFMCPLAMPFWNTKTENKDTLLCALWISCIDNLNKRLLTHIGWHFQSLYSRLSNYENGTTCLRDRVFIKIHMRKLQPTRLWSSANLLLSCHIKAIWFLQPH